MEQMDKDNCSICLEEITASSSVAAKDTRILLKTPCNHVFHRTCLLDWFKRGCPGNCCPLCKQTLKEKDTIPVSFKNYKMPLRRSARIKALTSAHPADQRSLTTPVVTSHELRLRSIGSMITDIMQHFFSHPDMYSVEERANLDRLMGQVLDVLNE